MTDTVDAMEDHNEIFVQDGVLLKQTPAIYITHLNSIGTLYVSECLSSNHMRFVEWKPNDVTVDSDFQDQEWAVVNTIQKRTRTLSGNFPPDYHNKVKCIKLNFNDIKSFRVANKFRQLTFYDGASECLSSFLFQHGNCEVLLGTLRKMLKTIPAKRDKHLYIVVDNPEMQQLDRSFAELKLNNDSQTIWTMFKNIKEHPYEATFETFSKLTDYGEFLFHVFLKFK